MSKDKNKILEERLLKPDGFVEYYKQSNETNKFTKVRTYTINGFKAHDTTYERPDDFSVKQGIGYSITTIIEKDDNYINFTTTGSDKEYVVEFEPIFEKVVRSISNYDSVFTAEEKQNVKLWIKKNNLNQFRDITEADYRGTPFYTSASGEQISLKDYLIQTYPDMPWNNN